MKTNPLSADLAQPSFYFAAMNVQIGAIGTTMKTAKAASRRRLIRTAGQASSGARRVFVLISCCLSGKIGKINT